MTVITRASLDRLREFVKQGGKVIFVGKTPTLILDKTFMDAKEVPDLSFATLVESSGDITPAVLAALPKPDVKLDAPFERLTYNHRAWRDGDMYFFFNESNKAETRTATIAGHGKAQDWDMATGEIHPMAGVVADGDSVKVPLVLGPYEAKVIVVGPLPAGVAAAEPSFAAGTTVADLSSDWNVDLGGTQVTTAIKPWEELGKSGFAGPATYKKEFTVAATPKGQHVFLEIGDVHDYAKVTLNGKEIGARAVQPYRWDVTSALKPGANDLVIEVNATVEGRGPGGAPVAVAAAVAAPGLAPAPGAGGTGAGGTGAGGTGVGGATGVAGGGRRRQGQGAGAAGGAAPAAGAYGAVGGGGRTTPAPPATSGLLGEVKLVVH
jgi:hypothetical protein